MALQVVQTNFDKVILSQIVELEIGPVVQEIITDATPEALGEIEWLDEPYVSGSGQINAIVQAFLFDFGERKLMIDTCIGNDKDRTDVPDWANLNLDFLGSLKSIDIDPLGITDVLCTHLHMDHVGWNTRYEQGVWKPTFPNAKYYFGKTDYEYWKGKPENEIRDDHMSFDDSVQPIVDAGLAVLVEETADLGDGVMLVPSFGHTPGHVSVQIDAGNATLIVTGDALHHPCQIARPDWSTEADYDQNLAATTRKGLLKDWFENQIVILGSHFSIPSLGNLSRDKDENYRFVPVSMNGER